MWRMTTSTLPGFEEMLNPVLEALAVLGGSGTVEEIDGVVADLMALSEAQRTELHDPERGPRTELAYRLGWSRTYLKKYGLLENSMRGVWALTPAGRTIDYVDEREVVRFVRELDKQLKLAPTERVLPGEDDSWREALRRVLLELEPDAFERLFQRVLRESGFVEVIVTGRSGDGGIDGAGVVKIAEFLSFRVLFQCKRWRNPVGPDVVRDFQGAMTGRADKGLLVTTSAFTRAAMLEATRDGAPAVDLIDGDALINKLKTLGLGVTTRRVTVEEVAVDEDWFRDL
jgi:restriction system protein